MSANSKIEAARESRSGKRAESAAIVFVDSVARSFARAATSAAGTSEQANSSNMTQLQQQHARSPPKLSLFTPPPSSLPPLIRSSQAHNANAGTSQASAVASSGAPSGTTFLPSFSAPAAAFGPSPLSVTERTAGTPFSGANNSVTTGVVKASTSGSASFSSHQPLVALIGPSRQFDFKSQGPVKSILEKRSKILRGVGVLDRLAEIPELQLPATRSNMPERGTALQMESSSLNANGKKSQQQQQQLSSYSSKSTTIGGGGNELGGSLRSTTMYLSTSSSSVAPHVNSTTSASAATPPLTASSLPTANAAAVASSSEFLLEHPKIFVRVPVTKDPFVENLINAIGKRAAKRLMRGALEKQAVEEAMAVMLSAAGTPAKRRGRGGKERSDVTASSLTAHYSLLPSSKGKQLLGSDEKRRPSNSSGATEDGYENDEEDDGDEMDEETGGSHRDHDGRAKLVSAQANAMSFNSVTDFTSALAAAKERAKRRRAGNFRVEERVYFTEREKETLIERRRAELHSASIIGGGGEEEADDSKSSPASKLYVPPSEKYGAGGYMPSSSSSSSTSENEGKNGRNADLATIGGTASPSMSRGRGRNRKASSSSSSSSIFSDGGEEEVGGDNNARKGKKNPSGPLVYDDLGLALPDDKAAIARKQSTTATNEKGNGTKRDKNGQLLTKAERAAKRSEARQRWQQEAVLSVLNPLLYERKRALRRDVGVVKALGAEAGERQVSVQQSLLRHEQRAHRKAFMQQLNESNLSVKTARKGTERKVSSMKDLWAEDENNNDNENTKATNAENCEDGKESEQQQQQPRRLLGSLLPPLAPTLLLQQSPSSSSPQCKHQQQPTPDEPASSSSPKAISRKEDAKHNGQDANKKDDNDNDETAPSFFFTQPTVIVSPPPPQPTQTASGVENVKEASPTSSPNNANNNNNATSLSPKRAAGAKGRGGVVTVTSPSHPRQAQQQKATRLSSNSRTGENNTNDDPTINNTLKPAAEPKEGASFKDKLLSWDTLYGHQSSASTSDLPPHLRAVEEKIHKLAASRKSEKHVYDAKKLEARRLRVSRMFAHDPSSSPSAATHGHHTKESVADEANQQYRGASTRHHHDSAFGPLETVACESNSEEEDEDDGNHEDEEKKESFGHKRASTKQHINNNTYNNTNNDTSLDSASIAGGFGKRSQAGSSMGHVPNIPNWTLLGLPMEENGGEENKKNKGKDRKSAGKNNESAFPATSLGVQQVNVLVAKQGVSDDDEDEKRRTSLGVESVDSHGVPIKELVLNMRTSRAPSTLLHCGIQGREPLTKTQAAFTSNAGTASKPSLLLLTSTGAEAPPSKLRASKAGRLNDRKRLFIATHPKEEHQQQTAHLQTNSPNRRDVRHDESGNPLSASSKSQSGSPARTARSPSPTAVATGGGAPLSPRSQAVAMKLHFKATKKARATTTPQPSPYASPQSGNLVAPQQSSNSSHRGLVPFSQSSSNTESGKWGQRRKSKSPLMTPKHSPLRAIYGGSFSNNTAIGGESEFVGMASGGSRRSSLQAAGLLNARTSSSLGASSRTSSGRGTTFAPGLGYVGSFNYNDGNASTTGGSTSPFIRRTFSTRSSSSVNSRWGAAATLSASVVAYCKENDVTPNEALVLMSEERQKKEEEREAAAARVAQQKAEEQQRRELLEKFGPVSSHEVFNAVAIEPYRLATEHLQREEKIRQAAKARLLLQKNMLFAGQAHYSNTTNANNFLGLPMRGGGGGGGSTSPHSVSSSPQHARRNRHPLSSASSATSTAAVLQPPLGAVEVRKSTNNINSSNAQPLSGFKGVGEVVKRKQSAFYLMGLKGARSTAAVGSSNASSFVGSDRGSPTPLEFDDKSKKTFTNSRSPSPAGEGAQAGKGNTYSVPLPLLVSTADDPNGCSVLASSARSGDSTLPSAIVPTENNKFGTTTAENPSAAAIALLNSASSPSPPPAAVPVPSFGFVRTSSLLSVATAVSSVHEGTGTCTGGKKKNGQHILNAKVGMLGGFQTQRHGVDGGSVKSPNKREKSQRGRGRSAMNMNGGAAPSSYIAVDPLSVSALMDEGGGDDNNKNAHSTKKHNLHGENNMQTSIYNIAMNTSSGYSLAHNGGPIDSSSSISNAHRVASPSKKASSAAPAPAPAPAVTIEGDGVASSSFVGKVETLLQEAAEAEAQRARERTRKHREEAERLVDPEEAVASFEARQVQRLAKKVATLHSTRNTLSDLDRDLTRKQAMRETEFAKKREAVNRGPLPNYRAVTPNRVWRKINASLKSEQARMLAAETHQHTVEVAGPILSFLKNHYKHPVAIAICERAERAVADGSIDKRSRGRVPYSSPPAASSSSSSSGAAKKAGVIGDNLHHEQPLPVLTTTDPQGHQTTKTVATLLTTRNFPKNSPQRLYADELFSIPSPTDLLCDDVVSVLVHTSIFFGLTRNEVSLMLQDKASSLVMNHVRHLKKAIGVAD